MRVRIAASVTVLGLLWAGMPTASAAESPTYNQDVGSILLENCASCHRPNQVAPMSLLSYKDARPWARAIKSKVASREMPPWFADPSYGTFSNDISLTDDEIATVVAWVDAGSPEGQPRGYLPSRTTLPQHFQFGGNRVAMWYSLPHHTQ